MSEDNRVHAHLLSFLGNLHCDLITSPVFHIALEHIEHGVNQEVGISWYWELSMSASERDAAVCEVVHVSSDDLSSLAKNVFKIIAVGGNQGSVTKLLGLHQHHTATRHGGR